MAYDTVIIGGGPAGSTVAGLLRKYDPAHRVLVLEREAFPRDHVGESQLPLIGAYLHELGVWERVEAAGFPIKVGAVYRWGKTADHWQFNFLPHGQLASQERPAPYEGDRQQTAFQVDRARYDEILLNHAADLGAEVRQRTKVVRVHREDDRVTGLELANGEVIRADHYVDATGASGLLRRAMDVGVDSPTMLRNIALWDYWEGAEWAEQIGNGGTRVLVLSLGYGWIWFIPISETRTSVGVITAADHFKEVGEKPLEFYLRAISEEPTVRRLLAPATREEKFASTNDWSYVADRFTGDNWYLCGDACGFADPILAAGMTLAHGSAREVAYSILAEREGRHDVAWLRQGYEDGHRRRIRQHIRFADYWYSANGQFTDLQHYTTEIARDAGLNLDPQQAFQWLGTGGFANDDLGQPSVGAYNLWSVHRITAMFSDATAGVQINRFNEFRLNQVGVQQTTRPNYSDGQITAEPILRRGDQILPLHGPYGVVVNALHRESHYPRLVREIERRLDDSPLHDAALTACVAALEAMVCEGWVVGKRNKKLSTGPWVDLNEPSPFLVMA